MMVFLLIRNVNISQWLIIPNSKCEQREGFCLTASFVLQTLKHPEVPPQGLVSSLCGPPVGWPVHSTCLHCLHRECKLTTSEPCADILKRGCCFSRWVQAFTRGWSHVGEGSSLALVGKRKQKEAPVSCLYCLQAVCSAAWAPSHATAKPDFMGLWLGKENVPVSGWQHLQECCVLPGG